MRWYEWVGMVFAALVMGAIYYLAWHFLEAMEFHRRYRHHHRRSR